MNEITKMLLVTVIICSFSATLLASLNGGLADRISKQEDFYVRGPVIKELLKGSPNDPLADRVTLTKGEDKINIYPWIEDGKVRRVALERAGEGGYGGGVTVMTTIDLESNKIFGVRVTQHKETPGVGTRAAEPSYLAKYDKLSIDQDIKLSQNGGQIDAVSGATRTSTAVADGVNKAAKFVLENKDEIIKKIQEAKG